MKGYLLLTAGVLTVVLSLYVLAVSLEIPVLTDPVPLMRRSGALAAVIGVGLLSLDVVVPVPSSLVMIAHGALFGLWGGAGLSLLGGAAATLVGFLAGRFFRDPVRRLAEPRLRARTEQLLGRWEWLAVLATRPVSGTVVFGAVLGLTALAALVAVVVCGNPLRAAGR